MSKSPKPPSNPQAMRVAFARAYPDPRMQRLLIMQRFAARVCEEFEHAVVKGGLGLEMRLDTPRMTKDTDLVVSGSHDLLHRLARAGDIDMGDFLRFRVRRPTRGESTLRAPGMPYPAERFAVQAFFGQAPLPARPDRAFSAEVSVRSRVAHEIFESRWDAVPGGVPVGRIRIYSVAWQIAEKVHAFSDPRHRDATNAELMRPRDLVDLCRCAIAKTATARVTAQTMRAALEATFEQRKTAAAADGVELPDLPGALPPVPERWRHALEQQLREVDLRVKTVDAAHDLASAFVDPVLRGTAEGEWDPEEAKWTVEPCRRDHP